MDAIDYDYSWLDMDDLIFISVDVDSKKIAEKIIETSKAHLYTCAPYENTWLKNTVMMTASDYLALEYPFFFFLVFFFLRFTAGMERLKASGTILISP